MSGYEDICPKPNSSNNAPEVFSAAVCDIPLHESIPRAHLWFQRLHVGVCCRYHLGVPYHALNVLDVK